MSAGAPVAFFPGLLCDPQLWQPQLGALGAAISPWIADFTRDDTIAGMASHALAECPWPKFSLAALSMGGYVAMEVMRQAPERVERLALLDTQARSDTPEARERRLALMEIARRDGIDPVMDRMMPLLLHGQHLNDARLTGIMRSMAATVGVEGFLRQQKAIMGRVDSNASLRAISCPALVLCGEHDLLTPVERHEEIAKNIRGSALQIVPGCGHISTLEAPDVVNRALSTWLGS